VQSKIYCWIAAILTVGTTARAEAVKIFERSAVFYVTLVEQDRALALFDALDVPPQVIPGECYSEDVCYPTVVRKTVSSGPPEFYCVIDSDRSRPYCQLEGNYSTALSFTLSGSAASITANALAIVGNPYQSSNGLVSISCSDTECEVAANAITDYWLDHNNFFFAQHEYGGYGRSVLYPFTVNDEGERLHDVLNLPEDIYPDRATKTLRAGNFTVACTRFIASYYLYRYRCNWDVPIPNGPLAFPVNVTVSLSGDAATQIYDALDVPGPIKEFRTGDGLYSFDDLYAIVCAPDQCNIRIRRPPLTD